MGALALTKPTREGTANPGAAVTAADWIDRTTLGSRGVILEIINGNVGADAVTISDASSTPSEAAAAANAPNIPAGQNRVFKITPAMADPASGRVNITHSVIATVTYKMYPRD